MQFHIETDKNIEGRQQLSDYVESVVTHAVEKYADHLTHVEAHLGDVNGSDKSGADDMRCLLEARVSGIKNIAVSHHAESLHLAIDGAAMKLQHALASAVGKLQDKQQRAQSLGHLSADLIAEADSADESVK